MQFIKYGGIAIRKSLHGLKQGLGVREVARKRGVLPRLFRRHRDDFVKHQGEQHPRMYGTVFPANTETALKDHIFEKESRLLSMTAVDIRKLAFELAEEVKLALRFEADLLERNDCMAV